MYIFIIIIILYYYIIIYILCEKPLPQVTWGQCCKLSNFSCVGKSMLIILISNTSIKTIILPDINTSPSPTEVKKKLPVTVKKRRKIKLREETQRRKETANNDYDSDTPIARLMGTPNNNECVAESYGILKDSKENRLKGCDDSVGIRTNFTGKVPPIYRYVVRSTKTRPTSHTQFLLEGFAQGLDERKYRHEENLE